MSKMPGFSFMPYLYTHSHASVHLDTIRYAYAHACTKYTHA